MNPFAAPKDYSEMLNKIVFFTIIIALGFTVLVAKSSQPIYTFLNQFSIKISFSGIESIPIAYAIVAALVALIARIIRLHDKISDLFKIREVFDIQEILVPLAGEVGKPITLALIGKIKFDRDKIMSDVFYKYASSTKPVIDPHSIIMALDKWSWFWILIEGLVVALLALITLLIVSAYKAAAWTATGMFVGIILATFINRVCAVAAHHEVREITTDPARYNEIKRVFDAL